MDLSRDKKQNKNYQKLAKILLQSHNIQSQKNSCFTPAIKLKTGKHILISIFITQKRKSDKLQTIRKDHTK